METNVDCSLKGLGAFMTRHEGFDANLLCPEMAFTKRRAGDYSKMLRRLLKDAKAINQSR